MVQHGGKAVQGVPLGLVLDDMEVKVQLDAVEVVVEFVAGSGTNAVCEFREILTDSLGFAWLSAHVAILE